jgi:hypothetical protein
MTNLGRRDQRSAYRPIPVHPGQHGGCGTVRMGCARKDKAYWVSWGVVGGWGELQTLYLHQLPPVLPKNSFFSEFQMNFFQLPSSLAFPRAMVAGQQRPRRQWVGDCGERPGVLPGCQSASPAWLSAGRRAAAAAALRVRDARRRS